MHVYEEEDEAGAPEAWWSGPGDVKDIAISGRCVIVDTYREYWANGRKGDHFRSEVLINPTWEELLVIATRVIEKTADWHHIYLEGVREQTSDLVKLSQAFEDDPIREYRLMLGS